MLALDFATQAIVVAPQVMGAILYIDGDAAVMHDTGALGDQRRRDDRKGQFVQLAARH
ncbi:hypothetical protein D3C77_322660 [compost metagenome]